MIEETVDDTAAWMAQRASWVPATHSTPDKRHPLFFSSACFRSSISGQGQAGDCVKTAGTKPTDLGPRRTPDDVGNWTSSCYRNWSRRSGWGRVLRPTKAPD